MIKQIIVKQGKFKLNELKPGEMQAWGKRWYLACPRCGMALVLNHKVSIVNDKATISPSVGHLTCGLHVFVKENKIQYLSDMRRKR